MKGMMWRWGLAGLLGMWMVSTGYAVPNPAAAYAEKMGYLYTATDAGGTVTMPDGVVLDAWDFFRGKVGSEYAYGAQYGYDTINRSVQTNGYVRSYAVCVPKDPRKAAAGEEVTLLNLMRRNGEPLWEEASGAPPAAVESILKTAPLKTFDKKALPSSFDWRNRNGASYIGAVRNQGSCGSCYSFGAAAAAEGAYNYALGKTNSQCQDFSEAYIAWCLGKYGAYSDHFGGCDGADYDYQELEALTVEGICNESQMPYNSGSDPGSCTYSGTTTVFEAWYRVPSGNIDAIKTAIMTYGVVDAAVLTDDAFMEYDTGVYDNNNNTCDQGYNETSDHAISLVGWDDNPPEGGGGVFILRNSWGASGTGEGGYMRIRTNAAVVHCAVCYMVYDSSLASAPVFTSGTNYTATTGVVRTFTVTASGNPTPALSLLSSTATAGSYGFTNATGVLAYTPPVADVGTRTFTFRATNTAGSVTQTVSVTVSQAPPGAPASVWASATNQTDFTAAWSAAADATSYRLDVGTNATFTGGGGGAAADLFISEYIEGSSNNKAVEIFNGTGASVNLSTAGYTLRLYANGGTSPTTVTLTGTIANGEVFVIANTSANATILAQADQTSGSLTFNGNDVVALAKNSSNIDVVGTIGSSADFGAEVTKVRLGSVSAGTTTYATSEWTDYAADTTAYLGSHTFTGGGSPSYVAGYSNRTVAGTSQSVTGLTAGATYHFRVRAVNGGGTSANSSVANVTTLATLSAPVFGANPGPVAATAGVARTFTVSATGVPTPALALASQTASSGYSFNTGTGELTYTPPQADAGTRTFTFSATNSQGTASQTVTVNVTGATSPAFTGGAGPYATTTGVAVAFTVSASGTPAPTLALAGQTASSGYSFNAGTGAFSYTPPGADVGTRTFTFTAANAAGTVTQITSVSVSAAPTAPAAPASVWASATNSADFTAAWSASSGAESYRLDVATNSTFSGGGGAGGITTIFRETMGSVSATTTIAAHETANGFDNDGYTMSSGGAANPADIRATSTSSGYTDPAGNSASGLGNLWFTSTSAEYGFGVAGIDASGYDYLMLSFGYRKESGTANATLAVQWSTNAGSSWSSVTVSNLPAAGAATGWYMVSNLYLPSEACQAGLSLRCLKTGATAMRLDDILLQGQSSGSAAPAYVAGYSNRTVSGTSQSVTGLVAETAYYFRVRAVNGVGTSGNSATASVTTAASGGGGTPPVVNAIAPQRTAAGGSLDYTVTATATDGDPILSFGCTSAVDTNTWDVDTDTGYFLFYPTAAQVGTAVFSFTATDKDGASSPVAMTVTVNSVAATNAFQEWVEDQWQDPGNPDFAPNEDADGDGMTTEEEYVADTDPNDPGEVLSLAGDYVTASTAGESTGEIRFSFPASTGRYYQMEACTDLTNHVVEVDNLGWGNPDGNGRMTVTNATTGTWYGVIRALLDAP